MRRFLCRFGAIHCLPPARNASPPPPPPPPSTPLPPPLHPHAFASATTSTTTTTVWHCRRPTNTGAWRTRAFYARQTRLYVAVTMAKTGRARSWTLLRHGTTWHARLDILNPTSPGMVELRSRRLHGCSSVFVVRGAARARDHTTRTCLHAQKKHTLRTGQIAGSLRKRAACTFAPRAYLPCTFTTCLYRTPVHKPPGACIPVPYAVATASCL